MARRTGQGAGARSRGGTGGGTASGRSRGRTTAGSTRRGRCSSRGSGRSAEAARARSPSNWPTSPRDGETGRTRRASGAGRRQSEEHTSELQSPCNLVCRLLLEKKKKNHHSLFKEHMNSSTKIYNIFTKPRRHVILSTILTKMSINSSLKYEHHSSTKYL